ncbi:MAG: Zn-dependent alcohol dehydrogenase [SAR202 cluster bacterium]|nr:Zn-dependent alcohol dehydrogenase [SAR202 cluster bacterium]
MASLRGAVLYEHKKPLKVEELELPDPGPGHVLVKMMASGVCHSDWHIVKGEWPSVPLPSVLGHEGAGIVEAIGPGVTTLKRGDHVILSWMPQCGLCEMCVKGFPQVCNNDRRGQVKAKLKGSGKEVFMLAGVGSFGSYSIVSEPTAVAIDKDMPFAQASLIGCGVSTGVGAAINTAQVQPGTTVAVFGAGGVGMSVVQGARIAGATQIISVDMLDNKLQMAKEFGATHTVNSSKEDPVEAIKRLTGGQGVHYAFEAIGLVEKPFVQTIDATRHRGMTIWVGHAPEGLNVTISARAVLYEKTLIGSMYGSTRPHVDFARYVQLYKTGKLKLDEFITKRFTLNQVNDAFDAMAKGQVARSVLLFE